MNNLPLNAIFAISQDATAESTYNAFLSEANNYLEGNKDQETINKMILLSYKLTCNSYWGTISEALYDAGHPEMVLLINFLGKYHGQ